MKRLILLMALFYLIQLFGANPGLFDLPLQLYLKETLGFSAAMIAWYGSLWIIPWTIKPLWGIISDSFPLFGYRMRSYFILCYAVSFVLLFWMGFSNDFSSIYLLIIIGAVNVCIAFSDVLTDKLMIVEGKPEGKTAILQAAQWSAFSFGGAVMMYTSGWIAKNASMSYAFWVTAFVPLLGLIATWIFISEKKTSDKEVSFRNILSKLSSIVRSKQFLAIAIFIAALRLHIYPPIIYYQRDILHFDEQFLGTLGAIAFLAEGVGAVAFGLFANKISRKLLLNIIIGLNIISTLGLIFMQGEASAVAVYIFIGFTGMIATLGILEIAAKACPVGIEATAYALLMSVYNLFTRPGLIIGGILWDKGWSFSTLVLIGSALTAICWFLIPLLKLEKE